ncbi:hypothetical protein EW146_g10466 [Bondarzewia mesenterica]|uniref:Uncharacterized protein n=1 Tax=Bondarzewia mesenterica TaxID=1095465 RepID=A0A4S4KYN7_9AGAM|nr:hypothetical protein EW146_g10466 [Bondarzewia mesenterica]
MVWAPPGGEVCEDNGGEGRGGKEDKARWVDGVAVAVDDKLNGLATRARASIHVPTLLTATCLLQTRRHVVSSTRRPRAGHGRPESNHRSDAEMRDADASVAFVRLAVFRTRFRAARTADSCVRRAHLILNRPATHLAFLRSEELMQTRGPRESLRVPVAHLIHS